MEDHSSARIKIGQSLSTRILHKLRPEHLRRPDDAKGKVQYLCQQRRAVLIELKGAANSDGTEVKLAVQTIANALGMHRATVFRRLDDLKALGLLVDEELIAYNKPRRRHLNVKRAQELLGVSEEKPERPQGLPECVTTELWTQFRQSIDCNEKTLSSLVAGLAHQFHVFADRDNAETFIVGLVRFAIETGQVPMDWHDFDLIGCRVPGCPGCCYSNFVQEKNEGDDEFKARWEREAIVGDEVMTREDFETSQTERTLHGSIVMPDGQLRPLATGLWDELCTLRALAHSQSQIDQSQIGE